MFTRTDTKAVKGAAILLMLLHHLAGFSSRWPVGFTGFFSLIPGFVEDGWLADLARNALVCVPLFFFLGGYGLYKRRQAGSFRLLDAVFSLYKQYWRVFVIFVPLAFLFFARPANTMPAFSVRYVIDSPRQFFIDLLGNLFGYKATFNSEWWFFGAYLCTLPLGCLFCRAIRRHESFLGDIFLVFVIDILTQNIFPALAGTTVFSGLNSNLYFYRFFELNKHAAPFFAGIVFAKYDGLAAIKRRLEAVPCRGLAALAGTAAVLLCRAYVTTDRASADVVLFQSGRREGRLRVPGPAQHQHVADPHLLLLLLPGVHPPGVLHPHRMGGSGGPAGAVSVDLRAAGAAVPVRRHAVAEDTRRRRAGGAMI